MTKENFWQFIKFCIVGFSNTVLYYFLYLGALKLYGLLFGENRFDYFAATAVAFLLSVFWSFCWNRIFVFKQRDGFWLPLLKTYVSYSFTSLFLNLVLSWIWIELAGIPKSIAPLINLCFTVPLNFILNKFWAFRKKEK